MLRLVPLLVALFLSMSQPLMLPVAAVAKGATPREEILSFHSNILVAKNGSIQVREAIRVQSTGQEIRHGIYRDFVAQASQPALDFKVIEVLRNGIPEPFRVEKKTRLKRIYIGSPNFILPPGDYDYLITYESPQQVQQTASTDRLYWNVTGTEWQLPMDAVSARVQLPDGVPSSGIRATSYTGPYGSTAQSCSRVSIDQSGSVSFVTTCPLATSEGLTILVDWPAGFVAHRWSLQHFVSKNQAGSAGFAGIILVLLYFGLTWFFAGKPVRWQSAQASVSSKPPDNISAAGVRYIRQMFLDNKTFTAAIVSMGTRGALQVKEDGDDYVITRTHSDFHQLAPEEREIGKTLFAGEDSISLKVDHRRIRKALEAFKKCMNQRYRSYFAIDRRFSTIGWIITAIALVPSLLLAFQESKEGGTVLKVTVATIVVAFLVVNKLGQYFLQGRTEFGQHALQQIESFRRYLLECTMTSPGNEGIGASRQSFERYIAYALALDLEADWAGHFHAALGNEVDEVTAYHPHWYSGDHFQDFYIRPGSFGTAVGQAVLAGYAHSAGVAGTGGVGGGGSGSGSGGGGGFSGGGGGAGGGGGW